jgi:hypothetical protein
MFSTMKPEFVKRRQLQRHRPAVLVSLLDVCAANQNVSLPYVFVHRNFPLLVEICRSLPQLAGHIKMHLILVHSLHITFENFPGSV